MSGGLFTSINPDILGYYPGARVLPNQLGQQLVQSLKIAWSSWLPPSPAAKSGTYLGLSHNWIQLGDAVYDGIPQLYRQFHLYNHVYIIYIYMISKWDKWWSPVVFWASAFFRWPRFTELRCHTAWCKARTCGRWRQHEITNRMDDLMDEFMDDLMDHFSDDLTNQIIIDDGDSMLN